MRVHILESCLRTHKYLCLTRVHNKDHSCCAKITHAAATKYPAVLPLFFKHLQHDLLSSHPLATCNMPSCGEGCICPRRRLLSKNDFRCHDCQIPIHCACGIPTKMVGEPVYSSLRCNLCNNKNSLATLSNNKHSLAMLIAVAM